MLTPEQLRELSENTRVNELWEQLEEDLLLDMARRVGNGKYAQSTLDWQQWVYTSILENQDELIRKIARINKLSVKEVRDVFRRAGITSTGFDNEIFQKAYDSGLIAAPPTGLLKSPVLMSVLEVGISQTNNTFQNFTNTIAQNINGQLYSALDRAYMMVSSNAFSVQTAIKTVVKDLSAKGVGMVTYDSGYKNHLDVAVRRALLTGINQTCGKITEIQGDTLGGTTVETTAHIGARNKGAGYVNHESWQGRWFSYKGRNPDYPAFEVECGYGQGGGILGWNCRHSFFFVFPGISGPLYKPGQYDKPNVVYNGNEITYYDATQKQREIERDIRKWKRQVKAIEAAGQEAEFEKSKVRFYQKKMRDFLSQTGLERQRGREQLIV